MTTIVASVEGFLRRETTGDLLIEGTSLLSSLQGENSVTVLLTAGELERTAELLGLVGVHHDLLITKALLPDRIQQLRKITHEYGYSVDLVIEPDPAVCAALVAEGYTTLGFFSPHYSRREWRPDHQFTHRPWDQLVAEVIKGKGE